jgi:hypothetical protein
MFFDDTRLNFSGSLDFVTGIVYSIGDYGFGAITVGDDLLWGKSGGVVKLFVVGPVRASI